MSRPFTEGQTYSNQRLTQNNMSNFTPGMSLEATPNQAALIKLHGRKPSGAPLNESVDILNEMHSYTEQLDSSPSKTTNP